MLPSTVMSLAATPATPDAAARAVTEGAFEPSLLVTLLLAAGMGLVLGPFLGVPQGRVLREYGGHPASWAVANSLAWALGMPVVFLGTAFVDATSSAGRLAGVVGLATLAAGAVVGAVHGRFVLALIPERADA